MITFSMCITKFHLHQKTKDPKKIIGRFFRVYIIYIIRRIINYFNLLTNKEKYDVVF